MPASLYSPPLTLGGHIWKPVPLPVRLTEVFLPHSLRLPVTRLHPQIASPPLLYSFLWSSGPVHVPRGWQGHHDANACLEKDWDPKMCRVGRWNCVSLPSFMAWQSKCSAWPFKTQEAVLNAYGDFFTDIFLSAVTFVALRCLTTTKKVFNCFV